MTVQSTLKVPEHSVPLIIIVPGIKVWNCTCLFLSQCEALTNKLEEIGTYLHRSAPGTAVAGGWENQQTFGEPVHVKPHRLQVLDN